LDLVVPAFAKINLDLRILGVRADGFHDLKTIFQTVALHDDLTFTRLPTDERNFVWKAASLLWRTAGKRRGDAPRDVVVRLRKRIPEAAGLGGGSSDAAAALLGLTRIWGLDVDTPTLGRLVASLGSDVPFFVVGGTALGLGRGEDLYPLVDLPRTHVVIVKPQFGVSTVEAYGWYDTEPRPTRREPARRVRPDRWPEWARDMRNDLELPVLRHHPAIGRIKQALLDAGAVFAAMSGSGSSVFGLFDRPDAARRTAADLARPGWLVLSTRTLSRQEFSAHLRPALARTRKRRIS
jgi:4-diphosphocytidyl-2-C-methyl-D-erythritol kinase